MPATSGKQYRFMQAMAHGAKPKDRAAGPSEAVAKEFISKTPKKKRSLFAKKDK